MVTPTPLQAHLLKAVQNLAYDNHQRTERTRLAGKHRPSPEVLQHLRIGERSREQIEGVALAVGVPKAWIDYARAAGERGGQWQPGQVLLGSGHVERRALTEALARDVRGLQAMAGVAAAHTRRSELNGAAVAQFRRVMGMTWQRLGAVSHALSLSEEERHQVWQRGDQHWSTAVAEQFAASSDRQLAAQWNQVSGTDFTAITMPVIVLQSAGITHDDIAAHMPISPDRMVELAATALTTLDRRSTPLTVTDPDRGLEAAGINAAIEATGVTDDSPLALAPSDTADSATTSAPTEVNRGHEP
ncbi:hypothetical protein [Nocardia pseudovaccinii]|uniref:hypothetical protein n=1 Tax=Nocardia pseudovaccinii TaxID=189540 RepID=UPI000A5036C9|nr:hypothetical protein [Nocardia pseudovaccinii]